MCNGRWRHMWDQRRWGPNFAIIIPNVIDIQSYGRRYAWSITSARLIASSRQGSTRCNCVKTMTFVHFLFTQSSSLIHPTSINLAKIEPLYKNEWLMVCADTMTLVEDWLMLTGKCISYFYCYMWLTYCVCVLAIFTCPRLRIGPGSDEQ